MRSPDVIKRLRSVFCLTFGPYAFLAPDSEIDRMADRLQKFVDDKNNGRWVVKVRLAENANTLWEDIKEEPTIVHCYMSKIVQKCQSLLADHSEIVAIMIIDTDTKEERIVKR